MPPDSPQGKPHKSPLVLIVDDNERNRKLARDVLRASGLRTLEATTGAQAVALAGERRPDVVLLDLGLPDMDGTEVVRELRSQERTGRLPVVAVSARSAVDADWLREAGFNGYIEKPIRVVHFPDQVRRYCGLPGPSGTAC